MRLRTCHSRCSAIARGPAGAGYASGARAAAPAGAAPSVIAGPPTRSFYMGFDLWPADLSDEGLRMAQDFAYAHGDIISVVLIGGVPWAEALDGKPFSKNVQDN